MSMIEDAADLPRITASLIDTPTAYCARCGEPLSHRPLLVGTRTGEGITAMMEVVAVCDRCGPIMVREEECAKNRDFAARMDRAVEEIRGHLAEIELILRHQSSPYSVMLARGVEDDWAALCHALLMCRYLAKRFSAAAIVETDIAAGGTGAGDAPRAQKAPGS